MGWTVQELLTLCFDQTTPKGEGGDRIKAQYSAMAFNACLSPIQRGIRDLREKDELAASVLMFLNTSSYTDKDVDRILERMRFLFFLDMDTKGIHQSTIDKINRLLPMILMYCKNSGSDPSLNKHSIAQTLDIKGKWYEKGRKINWDKSFKDQINELARIENLGIMFMQSYLDEVVMRFEEPSIKGMQYG